MPRAQRGDVGRLPGILAQARRERRTMTYLQLADALDITPPHRIHQTTRLVEMLLKADVDAGRAPLAALAVSKARGGLPAPGFFERARRLGLFAGDDPARFHERLLKRLFDEADDPATDGES